MLQRTRSDNLSSLAMKCAIRYTVTIDATPAPRKPDTGDDTAIAAGVAIESGGGREERGDGGLAINCLQNVTSKSKDQLSPSRVPRTRPASFDPFRHGRCACKVALPTAERGNDRGV